MIVQTKHKAGHTTIREYDYIEIIDLIEELKDEPSSNAKLVILKRVSDNILWKQILQYTYDTSINFGFRNMDESCFKTHHKHNAEPLSIHYMFSILDKLIKREITGNLAKSTILEFCSNCNDGLQDLLQLILWRDLDIGASVKTFNKAYGKNFLYTFNTMSARGKEIPKSCFGETKLNGQRLIIIKEDDRLIFKSRNGKEYQPPYLMAQANFLLGDLENIVLDCEIDGIPSEYGEDSLYNSDEVRTAVNGEINKFLKNTDTPGLDLKFRVNVFDMLTIAEFKGKVTSALIEERYERLENLFDGVELHNFRWERPVSINSSEEAKEFYLNIVSNKGEGAIFKLRKKPYQLGDSQYWVKAKQQVDIELEITGFYLGNKGGKRESTVGGVSLKSSCGQVIVNCGSGLTDLDIQYIMDNQDDLIGKIINVRFNTVCPSKDKTTKSLFLPRFYGGNAKEQIGNIEASIRDDKDEANDLEQILLEELNAQRFLFK